MRIFFGKIKPTADNKQIKGAFYETLSPVKLGEIQPGDYSFIISGSSVHLWRVKERLDIDGHPKVEFEIILENLPLSTQKLIAFKYFKLDSSLMVLTVRQSPKAFYQIDLTDDTLDEKMLVNRATYENENNYRKTIIYPNENELQKDSIDIQLYFKGGELHIVKSSFFDSDLFLNFIDNLDKLGKGRREKDKALAKIKEGLRSKVIYTHSELPILRTYDALFNLYGDKEVYDRKIVTDDDKSVRATVEASLELKSFNQIYYGPPGTGKTYRVRKSYCVEEETPLTSEDKRVKLDLNSSFWHLAPGRSARLWNELKEGNVLGYEWVDKGWGDLKDLTMKMLEEEGVAKNFKMISYLREVEEGDYICVISGKMLYGIAEVVSSYDYKTAIENKFNFQTVPIKWLRKFEKPLFLNTSQTKTFVRLNDGRRWSSLLTILRENGFYFDDSEIMDNKVNKPKNYTFISFHQSFSYEDFIEGIKPVLPESDEEELSEDKLQYEIVPGVFYQACDKAARLAGYKDLQDCLSDNRKGRQKKFKEKEVLEYYLIIDELNRGNVSSVFGELITLIEDDKRLGAENEIILNLPYSKALFGVPINLRIIGTMNTADRSIEALDTALRRRFSFEEVLPDPFELEEGSDILPVNLRKLLSAINLRIEKLIDRDHTIGHAFLINVETTEQLKQAFANKIVPLLQEYFYGDYGRVGLVIGQSFLDVRNEKASFMKVDKYETGDLEDKIIYSLKNVEEMIDEDFTTAVKAIYGE